MEISEEVFKEYGFDDSVSIGVLFDNVYKRIRMLSLNKSLITVRIRTENEMAVPDVLINGITTESGESIYTDNSGLATGFADSGSVTLKISNYIDLNNTQTTIDATSGESYVVDMEVTKRNFVKLTSTGSYRVSGLAKRIDVTAVGGGGGGGGTEKTRSVQQASAGGGGGYCTVKENVSFQTRIAYQASVGSGGSGGTNTSTTGKGQTGGTSSFIGVTASGGIGGDGGELTQVTGGYLSVSEGGFGNGRGGNGAKVYPTAGTRNPIRGTNGTAGSVAGYSSFTETVVYGGGGGGGGLDKYGFGYGAGGGGNGSDPTDISTGFIKPGGSGTLNGGGGGGGSKIDYDVSSGGSGGSGCIAVRIHF